MNSHAEVLEKDKLIGALRQDLASLTITQATLSEKDAVLRKLTEEIEFLKMTCSTMQSELDRIPSLQRRLEALQSVESQLDAKNTRITQLIEDLSTLRIEHGILQASSESLKIRCATVGELQTQLHSSKTSYQAAIDARTLLEKQKESAELQSRAVERAARAQEALAEEKFVNDLTW